MQALIQKKAEKRHSTGDITIITIDSSEEDEPLKMRVKLCYLILNRGSTYLKAIS
jgi:hypothetical protein